MDGNSTLIHFYHMSDYSLHSTILFYKTPGALPCHFMASRAPLRSRRGVTTRVPANGSPGPEVGAAPSLHRQPLEPTSSGTHSPSPAQHGPARSPGTGAVPQEHTRAGDTCCKHALAPAEGPALGSDGVVLWICKLFCISLRSPSGVRSWHGTKPQLQQQA